MCILWTDSVANYVLTTLLSVEKNFVFPDMAYGYQNSIFQKTPKRAILVDKIAKNFIKLAVAVWTASIMGIGQYENISYL